MKIHEYQGKLILNKYGIRIPKGIPTFSVEDSIKAFEKLNTKPVLVKAQIHAGGRGKGGGVKLAETAKDVENLAHEILGMKLVTHQTGPKGKEVKKLYIEEASEISKEFYLSCLVDRESSKIAFISSTEGGMDIEKVASESPEKIITKKIDLNLVGPSHNEIEEIISIFVSKFFYSLFNCMINICENI